MDYIKEYRRFIYSHYLADGVRITAGILLPSLLLGYLSYLQIGVFLSLGALCASITDKPGAIQHRRAGLLVCCGFIFIVALLTGLSLQFSWLFLILLPLFCFFFSMIGVYGARAGGVGMAALLAMVLMTYEHLTGWEILYFAIYLFIGGIWYTLLSLLLYSIRPYKLIQQAMGEYVLAASNYLRTRASFYEKGVDENKSYEKLLKEQVKVRQNQELIEELLFNTRNVVKESTHTSRILMMIYLDVTDLLERTMNSYINYKQLHDWFDDTQILEDYRKIIINLSDELVEIAISVSSGKTSNYEFSIDKILVIERENLQQLRLTTINPGNLEGFISLRHILDNLDDIASRIRTLHRYTSYDPKLKNIKINTPDTSKYLIRQTLDPQQFLSNFSLKSNIFRHSLRICIAAVCAFLVDQFLLHGQGKWVLLTVIVIIKPGYSLSKQRNIQRLSGTVIGAGIGWAVLFFIHNNTTILVLLTLCMIGAFSFIRWKYLVSVVMITLYLLFMYHLLQPHEFNQIAEQRIIDTVIGVVIAILITFLLPPIWERYQLGRLMQNAIDDMKKYFESIAYVFTGLPNNKSNSKEKRKQAWVSLANVSDAFTRMLSEPKSKQLDVKELHRFVVSSHMLVSHISTLSYYADSLQPEYIMKDYSPLIAASIEELTNAEQLLKGSKPPIVINQDANPKDLLLKKVNDLLQTRKQELEQGMLESSNKKYLSNFKSITDQFFFVNKIAQDIQKISRKIGQV